MAFLTFALGILGCASSFYTLAGALALVGLGRYGRAIVMGLAFAAVLTSGIVCVYFGWRGMR